MKKIPHRCIMGRFFSKCGAACLIGLVIQWFIMDSDDHAETLVNVSGCHVHLLLHRVRYRKCWQVGMLSGLHSLI